MIGSLVSRFACILVGHLYPLYRTFKAIRRMPPHAESSKAFDPPLEPAAISDMKRVVAFWAVHGVFTFAEFFIDFFVWIIPMYYEAKILFLVWLVHSNFSGAMFFFDMFIGLLTAALFLPASCSI